MKILITGANGFVGQNLQFELRNRGYTDLLCFDADSSEEFLQEAIKDCEFVFHLAGVNRPEKPEEFRQGNVGFTAKLLEGLRAQGNTCPIVFSSSIQAERDNPYGQSKREAEDLLFCLCQGNGSQGVGVSFAQCVWQRVQA